jgi:glycosyltransferase involved in cell wall biosynthesis
MTLKAWIVNPYAAGPDEAGITRPYNFARMLAAEGVDATVITQSFDHFSQRFDRLQRWDRVGRRTVDNVDFVYVRSIPYRGNSWRRMANMAAFGAALQNPEVVATAGAPDVIVGSSPHILCAFSAYLLARRLGVPHVFEVRDPWPQILVDAGDYTESHPAIRVFRWCERTLYAGSAAIITLYPFLRQYLQDRGAKDRKITWIPNGIDPDYLPDRVPPPEGQTIDFMYAGSHGLANGLDRILAVAERIQRLAGSEESLARVRFLFVGDGPRKQSLIAEANARALRNVEFRDSVPKRRIHSELQSAHAFIFTLIDSPVFQYGPAPNKLVDYMVAGRPVIFASNSPFNPVADAQSGVTVDPSDLDGIVEAVRTITLMDRGERSRLGARGREHLLARYDLSTLTARFARTLRSAIAGHAAPEPREGIPSSTGEPRGRTSLRVPVEIGSQAR